MTQLATDNFTRANGALGANWTTPAGISAPVIASNLCNNGAGGGNVYAAYTGFGAVPNDQYAQATLQACLSTSDYLGVTVRGSSSADTCYVLFSSGIGAGVTITLAKRIAGSFTSLASTTATVTVGDLFYLAVQGSALSAEQNGSTIGALSISDSSITSGFPGVILGGPDLNSQNLGSFAMGNFLSGASSLLAATNQGGF